MITKRILDLLLSFLGIILFFPFFSVIALWIKIDSDGPIFFRQVRIGQFGREFKIYKFRTMVDNAEAFGKQITVGDDYRITTCGKFLRKYKLDELPQLFNVLKGEMSFVGSRPEVPKYVALYDSEQLKILDFPPGITDLASIEFRNESKLLAIAEDPEDFYVKEIMVKKLKLNSQYIQNFNKFNIAFDFFIIFETIHSVLLK
jgi:lipopolysaccharide/colanic/teichoic acid biosynthesis glycosyltransferase